MQIDVAKVLVWVAKVNESARQTGGLGRIDCAAKVAKNIVSLICARPKSKV